MNRLGIIDEQEEEVEEFQRYFEDHFEVVVIPIKDRIEDTVRSILENPVDALAIDYKLKEHNSTVEFNGNDLFKLLSRELMGFPTFLITSYAGEATKHNVDPFKIISKNVLQPDPEKDPEYTRGQKLIEKINLSVRNYKEELAENEKRFLELISIAEKKELSIEEEEELAELDNFIEHSISRDQSLPEQFKKPTVEKKLEELLKKADELIKQANDKK